MTSPKAKALQGMTKFIPCCHCKTAWHCRNIEALNLTLIIERGKIRYVTL